MNSTTPLAVGEHPHIRIAEGLDLDCGVHLAPVDVAYSTYGTLSARRDNAILICHAFTGDQYVAEQHPLTGKPGWWSAMVGPGKPIDTDRFFVICSNVLGGCMGTTGPRSVRTDAEGDGQELWGTAFPPITIRDMVRAQYKLVRALGIEKLFAVIGGSMGGMQVLEWAVTYPHMMLAAMPIATAPFHSAQNIAFNEVGRQAIIADPDWLAGRYWQAGVVPARGLAVARMMAHITYLSEEALTRKFGRRVRQGPQGTGPAGPVSLFGDIFEVESYLRYQGSSFVRRFDANSYLTITRAMDWFDIAADHDGEMRAAFIGTPVRFCVVSFSSDWLFPTSSARVLLRALNQAAANVSFVEIETDKGHDAFLLEEPGFERTVRGFLCGVAEHAGLG
ncbi:homoserine O-acetyltransferase MetX [Acetobacter sp.]|uniref:homoserine O-acetyltransferase MetX n=1 Tax=Acetobacter sp. TaxID=440 RepID=UPI0039E816E1